MIVKQSSIFNASPERIWQETLTTRLLHYVASPLIKFIPIKAESLPTMWKKGKYAVDMKLFGLFPFGRQSIVIAPPREEEKNGHQYAMLDDGHGQWITKWRHFITIDDAGDGKTLYTDEVEVQAGTFTFFVWLFATIFFWHRQRRWQQLIRNNFKYQ